MSRTKPASFELSLFLLRHTMAGFVVAALFVAGMLVFDAGGLATLVRNSDVGVLAVTLLTGFTGLSFAGAQMAIAVMLASKQNDDEGGSAVTVTCHHELETG